MARSKLCVLAIGAALAAGGCASTPDYHASTPSPQRPVTLSGGDGTGLMMARMSRPLAVGAVGSQTQFAQVRDPDDASNR